MPIIHQTHEAALTHRTNDGRRFCKLVNPKRKRPKAKRPFLTLTQTG